MNKEFNHCNQLNQSQTTKTIDDRDKEQKIADLVHKFNTVIMGMIKHITDYYGDPHTQKIQLVLTDVISDSPKEPMSYFLLNIYKNDEYRKNILNQNDKFFMNHQYNEFTEGNNEKISQIFKFKNLWNQIDIDTKNYIKKSMMVLVKICQKYILSL